MVWVGAKVDNYICKNLTMDESMNISSWLKKHLLKRLFELYI